jgi:hypothetical protein
MSYNYQINNHSLFLILISITYFECACSYPACNAHEPYCYLWPSGLYNIFPHCRIKDNIKKKELKNTKYVF